MSRSGYSDDCGGWELVCWRGAVASAIRGARGQAFLKELLATLDAMPEKRLIGDELATERGEVCALGSVYVARGLPTEGVDVYDRNRVAASLNIAPALAAEIMFENDGDFCHWRDMTPEKRYDHMRNWVANNIKSVTP